MQKVQLNDFEYKEIIEGYHVKFVHSERMTMAYWKVDKDATVPEHDHHHEQIINVFEGEFEITIDGTPHHLKPGNVVVIPPNVKHSGRAFTDCLMLDAFAPVRDDYK